MSCEAQPKKPKRLLEQVLQVERVAWPVRREVVRRAVHSSEQLSQPPNRLVVFDPRPPRSVRGARDLSEHAGLSTLASQLNLSQQSTFPIPKRATDADPTVRKVDQQLELEQQALSTDRVVRVQAVHP